MSQPIYNEEERQEPQTDQDVPEGNPGLLPGV